MPLPRFSEEPHWADQIAALAAEEFDGELQVRKPGVDGIWNPQTKQFEGGTPGAVIIDWRPARLQHAGNPQMAQDNSGTNARHRFRFQYIAQAGDALVYKGLIVSFRKGRNAELEKYAFQVDLAVGSSHGGPRTVECTSEVARLA